MFSSPRFSVAKAESAEATLVGMRMISGGSYTPLFKGEPKANEVVVGTFYLDIYPVTRREFAAFIERNPEWGKGQAALLFADDNYLSDWSADGVDQRPVTSVSWFAAKAYCKSVGKRLPTSAEWEYAALASEKEFDGRSDANFMKRVIAWYSQPNRDALSVVGQGLPNRWGIYDLHGLVFEWVSDFNSALVTGESRGDSGLERNLYCGAAALGATETEKINYPAFMRYAFRNSLEGRYAVRHLGFRCASDHI